MPRYRVKSGKINLPSSDPKEKGRRIKYVKDDVLDIPIEVARKFEDLLEPLTEDGRLDIEPELPEVSRDSFKIVYLPRADGEFYDVVNSDTGKLLNEVPLNKTETLQMVKGLGLSESLIEDAEKEYEKIGFDASDENSDPDLIDDIEEAKKRPAKKVKPESKVKRTTPKRTTKSKVTKKDA